MSIGNLKTEGDLKRWLHDQLRTPGLVQLNQVRGVLPAEEFIAPTFENSWVNFGSGWQDAGYMRDRQGFVHLRGAVKSGTVSTAIFTLPDGYRPAAGEFFPSVTWAGVMNVNVTAAGEVLAPAHNTLIALSGVIFKAAV